MAESTTLIIIMLTLLLIVCLFVWHMMRHKHTLVIRRITANKKLVRKIKFREFIENDGTRWYKVMGSKKEYPPAPSNAIDTDKKGKMWVEAYENESGEITYIEDKNHDHKGFQPLTTNQRQLLIMQIKKAQSRKKTTWKDSIPMLASLGALVIICVSLMAFYGEIAAPVLEAGDKQIRMEQLYLEQLEVMQEIKNDVQVLKKETGLPDEAPN